MIKDILTVYILISVIYGTIRAIDRHVEELRFRYCKLDFIFLLSIPVSVISAKYIKFTTKRHYTN